MLSEELVAFKRTAKVQPKSFPVKLFCPILIHTLYLFLLRSIFFQKAVAKISADGLIPNIFWKDGPLKFGNS